ncbi:MAG: carbonic anhydrase [Planctomycetota bacterium]
METVAIRTGLHHFDHSIFGATSDLIEETARRDRGTLMFACSEQGVAPGNVSFANPESFVILQHLGACVASKTECEKYPDLSLGEVEKLFGKYDFRHVIVCGHFGCGVIRTWLQPSNNGNTDSGGFRVRFENGTRDLVDDNYSPGSADERCRLMVCEHVLCQIENLLTHPFIKERAIAEETWFHGWVVDDETARVYGYCPQESLFRPI